MMHENEIFKKKQAEEEKREKENDIRLQNEYTRLLDELEQQRE